MRLSCWSRCHASSWIPLSMYHFQHLRSTLASYSQVLIKYGLAHTESYCFYRLQGTKLGLAAPRGWIHMELPPQQHPLWQHFWQQVGAVYTRVHVVGLQSFGVSWVCDLVAIDRLAGIVALEVGPDDGLPKADYTTHCSIKVTVTVIGSAS